jgi:hypothetical protein
MNQKEWFIKWWWSVWILHWVMTVQGNITMSLSSGWQLFQADNDVVLRKKMCQMRWSEVIWPITARKVAKGDGTVLNHCFRPLGGTSLKFLTQISSGQSCPLFSLPMLWLAKLSQTTINNWNIFSCHIASVSIKIDSVTLKMEAVCSSETLAGLTTTQHRNSKDGHHLLKLFKNEVVLLHWLLQVKVDPHYSHPVWCWTLQQLWLFSFLVS